MAYYLINHWAIAPHSAAHFLVPLAAPRVLPAAPPPKTRVWVCSRRLAIGTWTDFQKCITNLLDANFSRRPLTYGTDKRRCEVVLGETEQDTRLAHSRIAYEQQFEQVIVSLSHLQWCDELKLSEVVVVVNVDARCCQSALLLLSLSIVTVILLSISILLSQSRFVSQLNPTLSRISLIEHSAIGR